MTQKTASLVLLLLSLQLWQLKFCILVPYEEALTLGIGKDFCLR